MNGEDAFFDTEITTNNLRFLSYESGINFERRICEISELVNLAVEYSKALDLEIDIYELLLLVSEILPSNEEADTSFALGRNVSKLKFLFDRFSSLDKAVFTELYVNKLREEGFSFSEESFFGEGEYEESFIYVKNVYSDEAYDVFSQDFKDPRVKYASSFKEAVSAVENSIATYCILPLEERGARLASVAELLFRADLKINSVIPVFGFDGNADVKYALISKHFSVPKKSDGDDRYLEIRLAQRSDTALSDILSAARFFGIQLYRVNTQLFGTEDADRVFYSLVFCGEEVDFTALLAFLTLFVSDHTTIGIYKNLES